MNEQGEIFNQTYKKFRGTLEVPWREAQHFDSEKLAWFLHCQEWNQRQVAEDVGSPIDPEIQAARDRWLKARRRILKRDRAIAAGRKRFRELFRKLCRGNRKPLSRIRQRKNKRQ